MNDSSTEAVYNAALEYIRRGWHVLELYGVDESGHCSCRLGVACRNAGKHPVQQAWTKSHKPGATDAYTIWGEATQARNVGVVTGDTSGFFALDIDPGDGGYETLAAWEAEHGQMPETYTVTTGSGGRHYYYAMPSISIRNSSKKLGPGVDIRGNGGQVVAAGSHSDKGPYTVLHDAPICAAPQWLLDLLSSSPTYDTADVVPVEDLPQHSGLSESEQRRMDAYAAAAVRGEVQAYGSAPEGSGNHALFVASCRLVELAQSTWNLLTIDEVRDALNEERIQRCFRSSNGGGQTAEEFHKTFSSAQKTVVGQGRQMPESRDLTPLNELGFLSLPSGAGMPSIPLLSEVTPGKAKGEEAPTETVVVRSEYDAWFESEVMRETTRLAVREEAKRRRDAEQARLALVTREDDVQAMLDQMLSPAQLDDMPGRVQLVENLLDMDSESWIIGPPGGFKSFVALDIAAHIATGKKWQGRQVEKGPVVYLVAEGVKGVAGRKKAWEKKYGPMTDVYFFPAAIQVTDTERWALLVETCRRIRPHMIVLDTQARITVGLEENSSTSMGEYVKGVTQLREATGACVLTVHHTGRNGGDARGSSAIDGAQDTEIKVTRKDKRSMTAEITTDKAKDAGEDGKILIKLEVHEIGTDPRMGTTLTSLALAEYDPFAHIAEHVPTWRSQLKDNAQIVLEALEEHMEVDPHEDRQYGITLAALKKLVTLRAKQGVGRAIEEESVRSALRDLLKKQVDPTDKSRGYAVYKEGTRYYTQDPAK